MKTEIVESLAEVDPAQWDALAGDDDPFVEHGFLHALETSGSVGPGTGWRPMYVLLREGQRLLAALPLYVKEHSFGEYIFDWSWAEAAKRAGIAYYPKLVGMVPFTPASGRRILHAEDVRLERVVGPLREAALQVADDVGASSVHLLFLSEAERACLTADGVFLSRLSSQFHWHNAGYTSFEDYLHRFRSPLRKQVRRERMQVKAAGLEIRVVQGEALSDAEWQALWTFYLSTCQRKGSTPYLQSGFFEAIRASHAHRVLGVLAYQGDRLVAGTLNFQKGGCLFGRYWGAAEEHPALHFELCYYQLIEYAIAKELGRFEAGAQGEHKLRRGLLPSAVHSAHWVRHAWLRRAVAEYLPREAIAVQREMRWLAEHGPFRREAGSR